MFRNFFGRGGNNEYGINNKGDGNNTITRPNIPIRIDEKNIYSNIENIKKFADNEVKVHENLQTKGMGENYTYAPQLTGVMAQKIEKIDDFLKDKDNKKKNFTCWALHIQGEDAKVQGTFSEVKKNWDDALKLLNAKALKCFATQFLGSDESESTVNSKSSTLRGVFKHACDQLVECLYEIDHDGFQKKLDLKIHELFLNYFTNNKCSCDDFQFICEYKKNEFQKAFSKIKSKQKLIKKMLNKANTCQQLCVTDCLMIFNYFSRCEGDKIKELCRRLFNKASTLVDTQSLEHQEISEKDINKKVNIVHENNRVIIEKDIGVLKLNNYWLNGKYNIAIVPQSIRCIFFDYRNESSKSARSKLGKSGRFIYYYNKFDKIRNDEVKIQYCKRFIQYIFGKDPDDDSFNFTNSNKTFKILAFHLLKHPHPDTNHRKKTLAIHKSKEYVVEIYVSCLDREVFLYVKGERPKCIKFSSQKNSAQEKEKKEVKVFEYLKKDTEIGEKARAASYGKVLKTCYPITDETDDLVTYIKTKIIDVKKLVCKDYCEYGFNNWQDHARFAFIPMNDNKGWVVFDRGDEPQKVYLLGDCGQLDVRDCNQVKVSADDVSTYNKAVDCLMQKIDPNELNDFRELIKCGMDISDLYNEDKHVKNFIKLLEYISKNCRLTITDYHDIKKFIRNKSITIKNNKDNEVINSHYVHIERDFVVMKIEEMQCDEYENINKLLQDFENKEKLKLPKIKLQEVEEKGEEEEDDDPDHANLRKIFEVVIRHCKIEEHLSLCISNTNLIGAIDEDKKKFCEENELFAKLSKCDEFNALYRKLKTARIKGIVEKMTDNNLMIDSKQQAQNILGFLVEINNFLVFYPDYIGAKKKITKVHQLINLIANLSYEWSRENLGKLTQYVLDAQFNNVDFPENFELNIRSLCVKYAAALLKENNHQEFARHMLCVAMFETPVIFNVFVDEILGCDEYQKVNAKSITVESVRACKRISKKLSALLGRPEQIESANYLMQLFGTEQQKNKYKINLLTYQLANKIKNTTDLDKVFNEPGGIYDFSSADAKYHDLLKNALLDKLSQSFNLGNNISPGVLKKLETVCVMLKIDMAKLCKSILRDLRNCVTTKQLQSKNNVDKIVNNYNMIMCLSNLLSQKNEANVRIKILLPFYHMNFKRNPKDRDAQEVCKNIELVMKKINGCNNLLEPRNVCEDKNKFYKAAMLRYLDQQQDSRKYVIRLCDHETLQMGGLDFLSIKNGKKKKKTKKVAKRNNVRCKKKKFKKKGDYFKRKYDVVMCEQYKSASSRQVNSMVEYSFVRFDIASIDAKKWLNFCKVTQNIGKLNQDVFKDFCESSLVSVSAATVANCVMKWSEKYISSNQKFELPAYCWCQNMRKLLELKEENVLLEEFSKKIFIWTKYDQIVRVDEKGDFISKALNDQDNYAKENNLKCFYFSLRICHVLQSIDHGNEKYNVGFDKLMREFIFDLVTLEPTAEHKKHLAEIYERLKVGIGLLKRLNEEEVDEAFAQKLPSYIFCKLLLSMMGFAFRSFADTKDVNQGNYKKLFEDVNDIVYGLTNKCVDMVQENDEKCAKNVKDFCNEAIEDNVAKLTYEKENGKQAVGEWATNNEKTRNVLLTYSFTTKGFFKTKIFKPEKIICFSPDSGQYIEIEVNAEHNQKICKNMPSGKFAWDKLVLLRCCIEYMNQHGNCEVKYKFLPKCKLGTKGKATYFPAKYEKLAMQLKKQQPQEEQPSGLDLKK